MVIWKFGCIPVSDGRRDRGVEKNRAICMRKSDARNSSCQWSEMLIIHGIDCTVQSTPDKTNVASTTTPDYNEDTKIS